jgi:DNA invertase Pin-like site-specific DNA recombinase
MSEKHTAVYLRVSDRGQSVASQKPDLERWAAAQEEPIVWYRDTFTGRTMDRPGWKKLEAAMRAGKVSRIVVWRLDRLGRTTKGLSALFQELLDRKVGLVSMREGLDISTPAGRLMAHVLASVAQYETEVRGERVRAGQDRARADGKKWGGSRKGRRVRVTTEKAAVIHAMRSERKSIAVIARTVHLSRPTVYSVLKIATTRAVVDTMRARKWDSESNATGTR